MAATKNSRLLALTLVLSSASRPLTRGEIHSAVRAYSDAASQSSFERMFERDKDELRDIGVAIETVDSDSTEGTSYQLAAGTAFLAPITTDAAERMALALAARMWGEATWAHDSLNALRKLELVGDFTTEPTEGLAYTASVDSRVLTPLLDAIESRNRVEFTYHKPGEPAPTLRSIEPWGVVAARGQWYVVGHDTDRAATRAFRLSRISGDIAHKGPSGSYEIPPDTDPRDYVNQESAPGQLISVEVELAPGRAARLRSFANSETDRTILTAVDSEAIVSEILQAGASVTVVSPPEIRTKVVTALRRIVEGVPAAASAQERAQLAKVISLSRKQRPTTSSARISRLLALVPWLKAHPGVSYDVAAIHFDVTVASLRKDLEFAVCTEFGTNLVTLDIDVWGNSLYVRDEQGIERPLQLARGEAASLLIGLRLLTQIPGPHDLDAIASISAKIEDAARDGAHLASHVSVAPDPSADDTQAALLDRIHSAVASQRAMTIVYISASKDERSERIVDPIAIVNSGGTSYLHAWCRTAAAARLFRLSRIQQADVLDEAAVLPDIDSTANHGIELSGDTALIYLDSASAWWAQQVPILATLVRPDGSVLVALNIASDQWAIRSLLGLGGAMHVIDPISLAEQAREAAWLALANYPG